MKQALHLKVSQHLALTPQLQQAIRLLQLSTLELEQELEQILHDNPMLERRDEIDEHTPEYTEQDAPANTDEHHEAESAERDTEGEDVDTLGDWSTPRTNSASDDDDINPHANLCHALTLREHLLAQLAELALDTRDRALVSVLIEELNEDGYLDTTLDALIAELPPELEVELDELHVALTQLQQFNPPGVAARSLSESLLLQLALHPPSSTHALAARVIEQHLPLLAQRDFVRIKKLLGIDDDALRAVQRLISSLNPHPAANYTAHDTHYVAADIVVRKTRQGHWIAQLNRSVQPKLRVNKMYAHLLAQQAHSSSQLSAQLQEAKWLIRNISQRFETILRVAQAIVHHQQAFFEQGETAMRRLVLRDIADELGLHESTISRVTTQKYLLCAQGLFELKYFFGTSLETESGGEYSATAIKAHLRQLVQQEDPKKPLSDSALTTALAQQGIQVARRTIAKYREALHILPGNLRKKL